MQSIIVSLLFILLSCIAFPFLTDAAEEPLIKGTRYLKLRQVAAGLGMNFVTLEKQKRVALSSQWTRMEFTIHKRAISIDGIKVHLGYPIAYKNSALYMSKHDYNNVIAPILTPQMFKNKPQLKRIVIDPGHGGRDVGAIHSSKRIYEKDLTLDLAKRLKRHLQKQGYHVTLTRNSDIYIPLKKRPALANQVNADLFISLHFNGSKSSKVQGIETFTYTPNGQPSTGKRQSTYSDKATSQANKNAPWNMLLSFYVQRELVRTLKRPDRGCKHARFSVLRTLDCPGVLIEGGFITHAGEGKVIKQSHYREKIAQSISQSIKRYQTTLNRIPR